MTHINGSLKGETVCQPDETGSSQEHQGHDHVNPGIVLVPEDHSIAEVTEEEEYG